MSEELKKSDYKGKVVLIVGHSLGGGVARYVTKRIPNTQAMVFDPAPSISIELEYDMRKNKMLNNDLIPNIEGKNNVFDVNLRNGYFNKKKSRNDNSGYRDVSAVIPNNGLLNYISKNKKEENIAKFIIGLAVNEEVLAYENHTNEYLAKKEELEKIRVVREYKELLGKILKKSRNEKDYKRYNELKKNLKVQEYIENEGFIKKKIGEHNIGPVKDNIDKFTD
ncbi:hypothetical protein [Streptobacillus canis]|uniref:hypothetical protein n=1 Tax=Streptobacillus canis TaxID=2678686 RepID=UPI001E391D47|nr:hypothetical protein [Streptobacillus canis]